MEKKVENDERSDGRYLNSSGFQKTARYFDPVGRQQPGKDAAGIIADGAIRSGKTVSMSLSFVMWATGKV